MIKSNRSQSSVEFIIIAGALLFFFVIFFYLIQQDIGKRTSEKRNLEVKEIAISVQDEIYLASSSSNGYNREFKIPEKISGDDYFINITENTVFIKTLDNKSAIAIPIY